MLSPNDPRKNPNPLAPDGSFQGTRLPKALDGNYVKVDEKSSSDWLEYVRRLSSHLNYLDQTNTINGDWSPFYDKQATVAVARLLAWPLARLGQRFDEHRELIEDQQSTISRPQLLQSMFDLLASMVLALDNLTDRLAVNSDLRNRTEALIEYQLAPALGRWISYYQSGAPVFFAALGPDEVPAYLRDDYAAGRQIISTQDLIDGLIPLNLRWSVGDDWTSYVATLVADDVIYGSAPSIILADQQIIHAVGHNFFHGVYEAFVSALIYLQDRAVEEWERLKDDPANAPHIALLMAFLEMRESQKEMLNGLTDRHLDFYYRRSLRTSPNPSSPPRALLFLEARKNLAASHLPVATLFRGGKDEETGTERVFASTNSLTVSPAQLLEKRAIFKVASDPSIYDFPGENRKVFADLNKNRLYSASVVDSIDGAGDEDLPDGMEAWYPFGHRRENGGLLEAGMHEARIGLAIASHYLLLKEGSRTVTMEFEGVNRNLLIGQNFDVHLSTEEGWLLKNAIVDGSYELSISLSPDDPAIVAYSEEIHGLGLDTTLPVARLELTHDLGEYAYHKLRNVALSNVFLGVKVDGMRQLALSGSAGVIDSSQPFFPFGPAPVCKEVLHVGSKELFQKVGADFDLVWEWKLEPTQDNLLNCRTLRNGSFASNLTYTTANTGSVGLRITEEDVIPPAFDADRPYQAGDSRGYMRMRLWGEWGHSSYPSRLAEWTAAEAFAANSGGAIPEVPPDLQFASIHIDYESEVSDLSARSSQELSTQYFHLTPFGWSTPEKTFNRFPFFPKVFPSGDWSNDAGALYLGISDWEPGSQLSLLIQIEEGSADPLLEKPEDHVKWHFLNDNVWEQFATSDIQDGTDALLRSGLVILDLSSSHRSKNSIFQDNLTWLRLSVNEKTDAVNRILNVALHGVEVVQVFSDGQSAGNDPLEPGTLAKLLSPLAGIKKVEQTYSSFGGSAPEERDSYFTRLSERLRHKDRAITEWDVEHLVLQHFPEVERIICLQHVHFEPLENPGEYVYHELKAGHYTVLPLGRSGDVGLRPYLSLSLRESIQKFLEARQSCHATLHVRNPLFEEVQVVSDVCFVFGTDEAWALGQIQLDLIEFISPWHDEGLGGLDFNAEVHKSSIVNYLEELEYVDFVKNVVLRQLSDPSQNGSERLTSTKLVSVLVSAPSHEISPLQEKAETELVEICSPERRPHRLGSVSITSTEPVA